MPIMKRFNNVLLPDYSIMDNDEDVRLISEAELIKQMLNFCYTNPGAKIVISVEHDNGHKATATLFDHVVLVENLVSAIEKFELEL